MASGRINFLDYAKAISIICVISIHVGFYQINSIVLFAMPLFFMATGYSFNSTKRTIKENIFLRFKTIMLPFFIFMLVYAGIEMIRAYLFGYGDYRVLFSSLTNTVYGSGILPFDTKITTYLREIMSYKAQPLNGVDVILPSNCHLWFLPAMFTAYALFVLLFKPASKNLLAKIACIIVLLAIAALEAIFPFMKQLPFGLGRGAIGAGFMFVGYWLKETKILERESVPLNIGVCLASASVYVLALCLGSDGSAMVRSFYGPYGVLSVLLTFVGGVGGAVLLLQLCRLIEKIPFEKAKKLLAFSGQNVMVLYLVHMAVKFLLDAFYICLINQGNMLLLDEYKMALLPQQAFVFMIIEIIVIIAVCLVIAKLKNDSKSRTYNK